MLDSITKSQNKSSLQMDFIIKAQWFTIFKKRYSYARKWKFDFKKIT